MCVTLTPLSPQTHSDPNFDLEILEKRRKTSTISRRDHADPELG